MSPMLIAAVVVSHNALIARRQSFHFLSSRWWWLLRRHLAPFSPSSWLAVTSNVWPTSSGDVVANLFDHHHYQKQQEKIANCTITKRSRSVLTQLLPAVTRRSHHFVLSQHFGPLSNFSRCCSSTTTTAVTSNNRQVLANKMEHSRPSNNSLRSLLAENQAATFFCRKFSYLTQSLGPNQRPQPETDYGASIAKLNGLQSNANYIANASYGTRSNSLDKTRFYLSRLGITVDDLDRLQVIHVAGTKGKGSTCAFVESILRARGYRTGFYSSPHLVVVRERIRINGKPISESMFSQYLNFVYQRLEENQDPEYGMPGYFNFLTVMAFHIFLEEKVDVAIMEVGIGGLLDCTNVVRKPVVTGVTSLDFDHCKMLGDTLEKIASQKAGIFKPGVPALTVEQPPEAMKVLRETAEKVGAPFYVVPPWSLYPGCGKIELGIKGSAQKLNASLAIQLADQWVMNHDGRKKSSNHVVKTCLTNEGNYLNAMPLTEAIAEALRHTVWHGRCQVIIKGPVTYFLDGAHTLDSVKNCCEWFQEESAAQSRKSRPVAAESISIPLPVAKPKFKTLATYLKMFKTDSMKINPSEKLSDRVSRVLVFNCTGNRNSEPLLAMLSRLNFDLALFTTNRVYNAKAMDADHSNLTVTMNQENETRSANMLKWKRLNPKSACRQVSCISRAIEEIDAFQQQQDQGGLAAGIHILVCGSVHLVGGFVGLLHQDYVDL